MNIEDRIAALEARSHQVTQTVGIIVYRGEPMPDTSKLRARWIYVAHMPKRQRPESRQ